LTAAARRPMHFDKFIALYIPLSSPSPNPTD
jgi:hypothetical protein